MFETKILFEVAREKMCDNSQDPNDAKDKIIALLKKHNFSLSQVRGLFHEIVNDLEDAPLM